MSYAENSRARFDYEILEKMSAGIVLAGYEVKAIKAGKCSIRGAYVKILQNEAWLVGAQVSPYQPNNVPLTYDPQRTRKLLVKKNELKYLLGKSQEKGLTLVPLNLVGEHGLVKLEFAIARGKKNYDKRATTAARETKRKVQRALKG
ncbi:MAG: SsrA-binding protein [Candidatus Yanofskybacteria bacterium RIFCSPLOWO2_01_FULL_49_25]|uniref:SsrA-binding protein n=1 Tax=Candidatus Yanofskybacteria bacterium RIFCSPLOWO2_01_FULL_49_25 TaxID=1802701 RepID=A0A1F8GX93_9BACT|nr:MAG: SsrA-binding protein [Candidatus Yanofskybacteria bacterium RIFCSPLOWO2_01_FULL_49_25]